MLVIKLGVAMGVLWLWHWFTVLKREYEHTRSLIRGVHRRLDDIDDVLITWRKNKC